jgi:hypothetical protein
MSSKIGVRKLIGYLKVSIISHEGLDECKTAA